MKITEAICNQSNDGTSQKKIAHVFSWRSLRMNISSAYHSLTETKVFYQDRLNETTINMLQDAHTAYTDRGWCMHTWSKWESADAHTVCTQRCAPSKTLNMQIIIFFFFNNADNILLLICTKRVVGWPRRTVNRSLDIQLGAQLMRFRIR